MKPITPEGFEAKFQANSDPWNYHGSFFEACKRRALVTACGDRLRGRALELACANGATTQALAPRCLRLMAMDASPTALSAARRLCYKPRRPEFRPGVLPRACPRGPFDLIVVSELVYYLTGRDTLVLSRAICSALARNGRVVALHHQRQFDDARQHPVRAHALMRDTLMKRLRLIRERRYRNFVVSVFEKGHSLPTPMTRG